MRVLQLYMGTQHCSCEIAWRGSACTWSWRPCSCSIFLGIRNLLHLFFFGALSSQVGVRWWSWWLGLLSISFLDSSIWLQSWVLGPRGKAWQFGICLSNQRVYRCIPPHRQWSVGLPDHPCICSQSCPWSAWNTRSWRSNWVYWGTKSCRH